MMYSKHEALAAIADKIDGGIYAVCVGDYVTGWKAYTDVKAVGNARGEDSVRNTYERLEESLLLNPSHLLYDTHLTNPVELSQMIYRRFYNVFHDLAGCGFDYDDEEARGYMIALLDSQKTLAGRAHDEEVDRLYNLMEDSWANYLHDEIMNGGDDTEEDA